MPRCVARVRRTLCCCCYHDSDEESASDSASESGSSSSFASVDDELDLNVGFSSPQTRTAQEWDSLFFTPDQLTGFSVESPVVSKSVAPAVQSPQKQGQVVQFAEQHSLVQGMQSLQMTNSLNNYAANLPTPQMPASTPLLKNFLAKVSISDVRRAMRAEPFWYCRYLKKSRKCRDIKKYRWNESSEAQGSRGLVRGIRSMMPLPQDLPSWLQNAVQVPKETNCTTVIRLDGAGQDVSGQDDLHGIADNQPVVLVMQTCSHDAPYGEHFRVQETLRFVRTDGGVELQRWVEVIWVKSLPWSMTPLKKIIEVKTVTGAEEADKAIVQFIQEAIETAAE